MKNSLRAVPEYRSQWTRETMAGLNDRALVLAIVGLRLRAHREALIESNNKISLPPPSGDRLEIADDVLNGITSVPLYTVAGLAAFSGQGVAAGVIGGSLFAAGRVTAWLRERSGKQLHSAIRDIYSSRTLTRQEDWQVAAEPGLTAHHASRDLAVAIELAGERFPEARSICESNPDFIEKIWDEVGLPPISKSGTTRTLSTPETPNL